MKNRDSERAFPLPVLNAPVTDRGMSLRDYIAIQIATATVSTSSASELPHIADKQGMLVVADYAYRFADAMIEFRNNKTK